MRYTMAAVLGALSMTLLPESALAARVCSQEEIRAMIFDGSSMRQVEAICSNAREAFSRPLPGRAPTPPPAPPPAAIQATPPLPSSAPAADPVATAEPSSVTETPITETAPPPSTELAEAPVAETPPPPDPFDDPYIVAVATLETLANSDWRSRIPRPESELLTPIAAPEAAAPETTDSGVLSRAETTQAMVSETSQTEAALPMADLQALESAPPPPMESTATSLPARAEPALEPVSTVPTLPNPEVVASTQATMPEPVAEPRPPRGAVPVADLSAVPAPAPAPPANPFPSPEPDAFNATPRAVAANGCPETSLWWSGGPSPNMEYIDICSIQLDVGDLDRYYELVPFSGLNATTDRRFDEDRNGISDKGLRVGNTIFWGGRDCSDGVVRIQRAQCDAVDKSGCAVVSLHLRARPGQSPTTLALQPEFFLLFPNGNRLPSEGKIQTLNYRGCGALSP